MAARFELGIVMPVQQFGPERVTTPWAVIRDFALRAEEIGFDTIWIPDELVWFQGDAPQGFWDGVSVAGAVAAVTSKAKVGTWVMSALHRNPGIIAKTGETLDEISGGRFVFGLGAGHHWPGQARAFGLPEEHIFDRFEEALEIIVPLLRAGTANYEGTYHAARELPQRPQGPRPGRIPILLGGNGPRGQRSAVKHADIYSCYVEELASVEEVAPRLASLDAICAELGRDPASIGRSVGVVVRPLERSGSSPAALTGSATEIADAIRAFRDAGFTQLEMMAGPGAMATVEALAPVVEAIHADHAPPGRAR